MKKTYSEKLTDPRWQKKRLEVMNRDRFTCKLCKDAETTLHVHHKTYEQNTEPWDYPISNFVTLCKHCHHEIERIIDNNGPINLNTVKILKLNNWVSGGRVVFVLFEATVYITTYDKNNEYIVGYNLNNDLDVVYKFFKTANKIKLNG